MNELIIKDRLENKMSYKDLCKKYNKHFFTIKNILANAGIYENLPKSKIKLPEQEIIADYNNGLNMNQIGEKYNCSSKGVNKLLKRNNVVIRTRSEATRIYQLNDDYFETIDTSNKAYFLGFIMADGSIQEHGNNRKSLSINLQHVDRIVLDKFKQELNYEGMIYDLPARKRNPNPQVMIRINSTKLCNDLHKYSITPRKTFTVEFPNINEKYYSHFIRGYFDGDGCIHIGKYSKTISFISGSKFLLESIRNIFDISLNVTNKKLYSRNNCFALSYANKNDVNLIFEFLYKDSEFCLERKYNKFIL